MPDRPRTLASADATQVLALDGARRSTLLSSMPDDALDAVLASSSLPIFTPDTTISARHNPDDALHVVLEGAAVERTWPSDADDDHFVRPVPVGAVLGLTAVLLRPAPTSDTRTLLPTLTLRIPGPTARDLFETSDGFRQGIARASLVALSEAEEDRVVLGTGDAMTRVTHRIAELARTWGSPSPQGTDIDLPLTQEQLGSWAGVSRETTVKCLQWMRRRGLITTSRRHIRVRDVEGLEEVGRRRGGAQVVRRRLRMD